MHRNIASLISEYENVDLTEIDSTIMTAAWNRYKEVIAGSEEFQLGLPYGL